MFLTEDRYVPGSGLLQRISFDLMATLYQLDLLYENELNVEELWSNFTFAGAGNLTNL